MDSPRRRRMSAEARREQILDVTHEIVAAEGFHAATPNRIADAAGVNRSLLYQQFGDLPGLFIALIDRESARTAAQVGAVVAAHDGEAGGDSPGVRAFAGVLHAVDDQPAAWRLFLFPPQGAPPELYERLAESQAAVRRMFHHGLARSYPALEDPEYTARVLHAACRELLQLRLTEPERATHERLIAMVRRLESDLLRKGPAEPPRARITTPATAAPAAARPRGTSGGSGR